MWVAPPLQHLNVNGTLNELAIPNLSRDLLDEVIATLLMACVARVYPHVLTGSFAPNLRFLQDGTLAILSRGGAVPAKPNGAAKTRE